MLRNGFTKLLSVTSCVYVNFIICRRGKIFLLKIFEIETRCRLQVFVKIRLTNTELTNKYWFSVYDVIQNKYKKVQFSSMYILSNYYVPVFLYTKKSPNKIRTNKKNALKEWKWKIEK